MEGHYDPTELCMDLIDDTNSGFDSETFIGKRYTFFSLVMEFYYRYFHCTFLFYSIHSIPTSVPLSLLHSTTLSCVPCSPTDTGKGRVGTGRDVGGPRVRRVSGVGRGRGPDYKPRTESHSRLRPPDIECHPARGDTGEDTFLRGQW